MGLRNMEKQTAEEFQSLSGICVAGYEDISEEERTMYSGNHRKQATVGLLSKAAQSLSLSSDSASPEPPIKPFLGAS